MKIISPVFHGILDYGTVVAFLAAPGLLGFGETPALLAYALAGAHLLVTFATDFKGGLVKILPFPLHGWIERAVGPALVAAPFLLGFRDEPFALYFFVGSGLAIIVVSLITDYDAAG